MEKHFGVADKKIDNEEQKMKWILEKAKINEHDFENVEKKLGVQFPLDFKTIVLEHNGSSPEKMTFNTQDTKERVAEYLLSFSENDKYNIIEVYNSIKDRFDKRLIPIMQDPFGNYICLDFSKQDNQELFFWNHENNSLEYISKSFTDFLNNLYE